MTLHPSLATIKKLTTELENLKKERLNQMEDREKGEEEVLKMQKKMEEQKSSWDEKRGMHVDFFHSFCSNY